MIKTQVQKLIRKCKTNDPFEIVKSYKTITVVSYSLPEEVKGFYQYYKRNRLIYINCDLPRYIQRIVCAHELGHALLHPKINSFTIKGHSFLSIDKYERQANLFAAELLLSDEVIFQYEGFTLEQMAAAESIHPELVKLKLEAMKNSFRSHS